MFGKCPSCGNQVGTLTAREGNATIGGGLVTVVVFCCPTPSCKAILGVQVDPHAIKAQIIDYFESRRI